MKARRQTTPASDRRRSTRPAAEKNSAPGIAELSSLLAKHSRVQSSPLLAPDHELRDEDWSFRIFSNEPRSVLVAACWYEYARESQHVRHAMDRWLHLQEARKCLLPHAEKIWKERAAAGYELRTNDDHTFLIDRKNYKWWAEHELLQIAMARLGQEGEQNGSQVADQSKRTKDTPPARARAKAWAQSIKRVPAATLQGDERVIRRRAPSSGGGSSCRRR